MFRSLGDCVPANIVLNRRMSTGAMSSFKLEDYGEAVKLLDSRRRPTRPAQNPAAVTGLNDMPEAPTFKGIPSYLNMKSWLRALGHVDADLKGLNVIHVAGTKGKGSTCAFTASFLQAYGQRTGYPKKIGLYTSPHLQEVRERIQINSQPLSRDFFASQVFEIWKLLDNQESIKPRYLQLLMLTAVHTFIKERVDVLVLETHHGGEFDATNIFETPRATGITAIGMDHMQQLGPTIENIAWHKAGIFKTGTPAFSTGQDPEVSVVLQQRAREKEVSLDFVTDDIIDNHDVGTLMIAIQRRNASLARRLADAFLAQHEPGSHQKLTPEDVREGAKDLNWPGRFQEVVLGNHKWFLDGAHNEMSVPYAARWFAEIMNENATSLGSTPRILIFSHISDRDGAVMLGSIAMNLQLHNVIIDQLIISTYHERLDGETALERLRGGVSRPFEEATQRRYIEAWQKYQPDAKISVELTVEGAPNLARSASRGAGTNTLVTGSLYLVGSALQLLRPGKT